MLSIQTRTVPGTKIIFPTRRSHLTIRNLFKATSWHGINFKNKKRLMVSSC